MLEGEQITPKLQLLRRLGQEGKAHVWIAEHKGRGCEVVVKLLGRSLPRNSSALHRFQREAEVAAQIKSPHIAQVLEHGLTRSGEPFLVTEKLSGEDLEARIATKGPLSPREVARLVAQLAKGLGKAHQLGLVHRNVKPSNVLLEPTAEEGEIAVKLLDFGLSRQAADSGVGQAQTNAAPISSADFMSPEQLFGVKDVDFRADLWSLAVLAYYALTGKTPFAAANVDEFATNVQEGKFEAPSMLVSGLSGAVDTWFEKAFQRDPAARFTSTRELAEGFERAIGLEGDRTSRTSYTPLSRKSVPGNRPSSPGPSSRSNRFATGELEVDRLSGAPRSARGLAMSRGANSTTEIVTVSAPQKKSSALLILALAVGGIAAIGAGLALLSDWNVAPTTAPAPTGTTRR
jgi:serine/threonine-protein kinase